MGKKEDGGESISNGVGEDKAVHVGGAKSGGDCKNGDGLKKKLKSNSWGNGLKTKQA